MKRKSLETESIFDETSSKKKLNKTEPSTSLNGTKLNNVEFLRKQINKSFKEQKLVTTGFGSGLNNIEKKSTPLVKLKTVVTGGKDEELSKLTPLPQETKQPTLLVSNDYGSDDSS